MILDSSALVSVITDELGGDRLAAAIDSAHTVGIGTPTLTESSIVLVRQQGRVGQAILSRFLLDNKIVVVPFDDRHWSVAARAFIQYGKGRHPARLNYGDCMTYATARVADAPLLFVGNDFAKTDLMPALA